MAHAPALDLTTLFEVIFFDHFWTARKNFGGFGAEL